MRLPEILVNPYAWLFLIVACSIIVWEILRNRYVNILQDREREVWINLGGPRGWFSRLLLVEGYRFEKYILAREYLKLRDEELISRGQLLNTVFKCVILIWVGALVVVLWV